MKLSMNLFKKNEQEVIHMDRFRKMKTINLYPVF